MSKSFPAKYKKVAGSIALDDIKALTWKANDGSQPEIVLLLNSVSGVQATPPTSDKHQLRVKYLAEEGADEVAYQFVFSERAPVEELKTLLADAVPRAKNGGTPTDKKAATPGPDSGAGSDRPLKTVELDAKKLLADLNLQKSILKEDKSLFQKFEEAVIKGGLPVDKFWASRVHLLRTHALLKAQRRGAYNVLSTIKPSTGSDSHVQLSLTREKIHDIFEQYPIVRQAYDETVSSRKLTEEKFWERFFVSRLYRRLRGEKVSAATDPDPVLDKYLTRFDESQGPKRKAEGEADGEDEITVPQYLDVEGNEVNAPDHTGNRPDITMQPGRQRDTVSLIRSMNQLSQRMLFGNTEHVVAVDRDHERALDEELRLHDLAQEAETDQYVKLRVRENALAANGSGDAANYAAAVQELAASVGDSVDFSAVGESKDEIQAASTQVNDLSRQRAQEAAEGRSALSDTVLVSRVQLSHATTVEFLRHFWTNFLSGDASQAASVNKLATNLRNSLDRLEAVVTEAPEADRERVRRSLAPLVSSVQRALSRYDEAVASAK